MAYLHPSCPPRLPSELLLRGVVAAQTAALAAGEDVQGRLTRYRRDSAIWIVVVVALAVILALGVLTIAMIKCRARGGNYYGGVRIEKKSWFSVWLGMRCTR